MLGYVVTDRRAVMDEFMASVARQLAAEGLSLSGAVQENTDPGTGDKCDMYLRVLGAGDRLCISQRLGPHARGCRLDSGGLESAAALVERSLAARPQLLIVNKFGKAELEGRGFRTAIGMALSDGIPVLTAIGRGGLPGFDSFVDGFGTALDPDAQAVLAWCRRAVAEACPAAPGAMPG